MRRNVIILSIILCIALFVSCENEKARVGNLNIRFGSDVTRTLVPDDNYKGQIDYYELQLTLPDGSTYKATDIKSDTYELKDMPIGTYQLVVYGYRNGSQDYTAKGNVSFRVYNDENSVTVPLTYVGNGSLSLTIRIDKSKLEPGYAPSIEVYFYDKEMKEITLNPTTAKVQPDLTAVLQEYANIPSGTYTMKILLKQQRKIVSTIIETILIMPEKKTSGDLSFLYGDSVDKVNVAIVPIDNKSTISGEMKIVGYDATSYTYGVNILEKPSYLSSQDVKYTWIVNGEIKGNDNTIKVTSDDTQRGLAFVSVVITSNVEGIIGSATTTASFKTSFATSNTDFTIVQ